MENSMKIVLIDTQYVKADEKTFKSVVQSLTGKDSSVAWINSQGTVFAGEDNYNNGTAKRKRSSSAATADHSTLGRPNVIGESCDVHDNPMLARVCSFKGIDAMLMELPPLEDLHFWLSNDFMD